MNGASPGGGAALAWRQLLRLGNVFTAASNVIAGFLLVYGQWKPAGALAALVGASMLLYAAGMALNDAFDAPLDARERPERPIPSGRISRRAAWTVGWSLLALGLALAALAGTLAAHLGPLVVAGCLGLTIVLYDGSLKFTAAGPAAMGGCRALNVLLGASAAPDFVASQPGAWMYAAGVGAYTAVLTTIARGETDSAARGMRVRRLVTRMILGFIVMDAAVATFAAGLPSGLAVLGLIIPSLLGARRAPMT